MPAATTACALCHVYVVCYKMLRIIGWNVGIDREAMAKSPSNDIDNPVPRLVPLAATAGDSSF
jgi:hypothetical protein